MTVDPDDIIRRVTLIDRSGLTTRDIRVLYCISGYPGECGSDIVERLELRTRSSVQTNLPKLMKYGMIIDTRPREGQAIPSKYYITAKGDEFLKRIIM